MIPMIRYKCLIYMHCVTELGWYKKSGSVAPLFPVKIQTVTYLVPLISLSMHLRCTSTFLQYDSVPTYLSKRSTMTPYRSYQPTASWKTKLHSPSTYPAVYQKRITVDRQFPPIRWIHSSTSNNFRRIESRRVRTPPSWLPENSMAP